MLLGVCRTISPIGPAHGLFGGRFILCFFACLFSVGTKALSVGMVLHILVYKNYSLYTKIAYLLLLFIPQIIMSLFLTIGFCKKSFQNIFRHPDLFLQPSGYFLIKCESYLQVLLLVTFFTFAKMSVFKGKKDYRIKFSPVWTLVNFFVSSTQILVIGLLLREHLIMFPIGMGRNEDWGWFVAILDHDFVREFFGLIVALHIFSGLLSMIFVFYDSIFSWSCTCCLGVGE